MKLNIITTLLVCISLCYGSPLPDFPFVFTQGEAEIEIEPNKAIMSFSAEVFHKNSSNATSLVKNRTFAVLTLLEKHEFEHGSLVSHELDKQAVRRDYQDPEITGYKVSRLFQLTINDLSRYEPIAKDLFNMEEIVGICTDFKRSDQKEIETKLLASACSDAKRNAEAMALGFNKELADVFSISSQGFNNISATFGLGFGVNRRSHYYKSNSNGDEFLFIPATIKLKNQVSALYKLK